MRSRYSAYAMGLYDYLLSTWHPSACPLREALEPALVIKWMRLDVLSHHQSDDNAAKVEFVARFKVGGRAQRLHEISRFVRDGGRWFYLDGEVRG